jgi:Zn-dependent protease
MKWSVKILTVAGIGVYIHVTFFILIAFVFSVYFGQGGGQLAVHGTLLVLSVFACVLLHEFGHAMAARRFGVSTKNIVLLPIGGVARLERMPKEPKQELAIALAGPAVNVAIAGAILLVLLASGEAIRWTTEDVARDVTTPGLGVTIFLRQLLHINVALVVFNLLPAFPMDGGRVLRSILAFRLSHARATTVAASVGKVFAVFFGLVGIANGAWILVLVAVFVYLGAEGEASMSRMQEIFQGADASAGMIAEYRTLGGGDTLRVAVERLLSGSQVDFPVVEGDRVLGVLTRQILLAALQERGPETLVRDLPLAEAQGVDSGTPLYTVWEEMTRQNVGCLPVRSGERIVGWITGDNIAEVALVRRALAARRDWQ